MNLKSLNETIQDAILTGTPASVEVHDHPLSLNSFMPGTGVEGSIIKSCTAF